MVRTLIHVTPDARPGDPVEVRATIGHPMETGFRAAADGQLVPRNILRRFNARYAGVLVFSAELHPAVAANPLIAFFMRAVDTGPLTLIWEGDRGFVNTETVLVTVR